MHHLTSENYTGLVCFEHRMQISVLINNRLLTKRYCACLVSYSLLHVTSWSEIIYCQYFLIQSNHNFDKNPIEEIHKLCDSRSIDRILTS